MVARAHEGAEVARCRGDERGLIAAVRICLAEADLSISDCKAMLWVARKRAARTGLFWLDALRAYSSLERSSTARARRIRATPWEALPAKLRELVAAFDRDEIADPCPRAFGWGGPMDARKPGQIPVRCPIKTANWYYRVRGMS